MTSIVVHLLPVVYDPAGSGTPFWLVYGPQKKSSHVRGFPVGERFDSSWNTRIRAWRVDDSIVDIATIAIERALLPATVAYCADCASGEPCSTWDEELLERCGYFVEMYQTTIGTDDQSDTTDPSFDWETMWKNAESRARSFFRRDQSGDDAASAAAVLGVRWPGATREDVIQAFRARASEAHPDHGGNDEKMKRVLHARSVLERAME